MKLEHTYQHQVRVYAEDVDYMGIVYHANYLCYFERARTELLRQNELMLSELAQSDTLFAISEINIRYLAPARLDDLLTVATNVIQSGPCSFVFDQEMVNQHHRILCKSQIKVVCVNGNLKPKRFLG